MASITIPNPATRQEVRADCVFLRNNLDVKFPDDPKLITDKHLIAKYGSITIDRMLEPQDDAGNQVGERVRAPSPAMPKLADILTRTYTRPDGTTFTGRQLMWDLQILIDHHKAEGLLPAAEKDTP
jgi:hypothetical protein